MSHGTSRRSALRGLAVTAAAGVAGFIVARNSRAAEPHDGAAANAYGTTPSSSGRRLAGLDQVSPQAGLVLADAGLVLTRDPAGTVHAFSAVCTHQGCTVGGVQDETIVCPCHGSRFDARTGQPVAGPATRPLAKVPVDVRGDDIFIT